MKKYSRILFLYSFTSFLFVIVFGSMNTFFKKAFYGTAIWDSITAFHSHFDQLCWLGAAAIGAMFHFMSDRYSGSIKAVGFFTYLYIFGTLTFSFAFLARGLGMYLHNQALEKTVFAFMASIGGLAYILIIFLGIYIVRSLMIGDAGDKKVMVK